MKKVLKKHKKFVIILLLFISIGFAYLSTQLDILGNTLLKANTWDVHFENVQVSEGSVTSTDPVIDTNRTTVTFSAVLNKPGDYYEFRVDAVNGGTIDAMIDSFTDFNLTESQKKYLETSVTYEDGEEIKAKQQLLSGDTAVYKIKVSYKKNLSAEDLPEEIEETTFTYTVTYVQWDNSAIRRKAENILYNVLKDEAESGGLAKKYTGEHQDSMNVSLSTKDIYHWYADNDTDGTSVLDKNNVLFGGYCWQMLRTTDTGGVKLIYKGEAVSNQCYNNNYIGKIKFNSSDTSPAYSSYMYGTVYSVSRANYNSLRVYSNVSWDGSKYTLTGTSSTSDYTKHHYFCSDSSATECSYVLFLVYKSDTYCMYIVLRNGITTVEEVFPLMFENNNNDSTIKKSIDNWFKNNILLYSSFLEDTIFCSNRSVYSYGGWKSDGFAEYVYTSGKCTSTDCPYLKFNGYNSSLNTLKCNNSYDRFSMYNDDAKLTYPVGLPIKDELYLLNNNKIRSFSYYYWTMTPSYFHPNHSSWYYATTVATVGSNGSIYTDRVSSSTPVVRPVISLKPGILYESGDGSKENPYYIKTEFD